MIFALLFLATCFLAYSNGANDNFKGVASLFRQSHLQLSHRDFLGNDHHLRRVDHVDLSRADTAQKI